MTETLSHADAAASSARGSVPPVSGPIFSSDRSGGPDRHGIGIALEPVAKLVTHSQAEGPFTVGIFGGPGSGKSFALDSLLGRIGENRMTLKNITNNASDTTWSPVLGVGLKYDFNPNMGVRWEVERISKMGSNTTTIKTDTNLYTVGLDYQF